VVTVSVRGIFVSRAASSWYFRGGVLVACA